MSVGFKFNAECQFYISFGETREDLFHPSLDFLPSFPFTSPVTFLVVASL